jgi:hypothetical protein
LTSRQVPARLHQGQGNENIPAGAALQLKDGTIVTGDEFTADALDVSLILK